MSTSIAPHSWARVPAVIALLLVLLCALPTAALAAAAGGGAPSEEGHAPTIDEIGTNNEVSNQYRPEPAEAPPFMRFLTWPLAVIGFLVALALLFMYLTWQPRFAEERRSRRRR